jgi:LysM repeat protein
MSFQDLDLKSSIIPKNRRPFSLAFKSKLKFRLLLKLAVASAAITLFGFSASNWEPMISAKAADSTPKLQQLHYKLTLPEISAVKEVESLVVASIEPIVKTIKEKVALKDNNWKVITVKSGDTLGSIFSDNGLSATTTHNVSALNDHTRALRFIKPGQQIHLLLNDQHSLQQMKYMYDITKTLEISLNENQTFSSKIVNYKKLFVRGCSSR